METCDGMLMWMSVWLVLIAATRVGTGFVTLTPPDLVVMEGETAVFTCSPLYSVATPILEKDGAVYTDPRRLSHTDHAPDTTQGYRVYRLKDVTRAESGCVFRCYMGGFFSNPINLTVTALPTLAGPSGPLAVSEEDPMPYTFQYVVRGFPHPHTLHWLRNGILFAGNERVGVVNTTTLRVHAPLRSDEGNYTLIAVNTAGHASLSLLLRIVYNEFLESPVGVTMTTGGVVKLRCVHRFGWAYAWFSSLRPLYHDTNKVMLADTGRTLLYGPVDYTDHTLGIRCVVHVRGSQHLYTSPPATLTVQSPPVVLAPSPTLVTEGSDVRLLFDVRGYPHPSHSHYLHNGHAPREVRALVEGGNTLYIVNVTRFDAGNYTLSVRSDSGSAHNTTTLSVLYAPIITPLAQPVIAQVSIATSLPCGLGHHSNPLSQVVWTAATFDLSDDPTFRVEGDVLFVDGPTHSHQGVYVCTVSNSVGSSSTRVTLLVLDPPTQPVNIRLVMVGPSSAMFSWDPPLSNGSHPVTGYMVTATPTVELDVQGDTLRTPPLSDCVPCGPVEALVEDTMANISGLVPGVRYVLLVTALSAGSALQGPPSDPLTFTTNSSVPAVVGVAAVVSGRGQSIVSWQLAYSGGFPVTHYHIQFRRANDSYWRNVSSPFQHLSQFRPHADITPIPPGQRSWQVYGLESLVLYEFRVRGVSVEGVGAYSKSRDLLLSHEEGVPERPARPHITCWSGEGVCVGGALPETPVDVLVMVSVGGIIHSTHTLNNHSSNQIVISNVSYHGNLTVQLVIANKVGVSEPSLPSLPAREFVEEVPLVSDAVGLTAGVLLGLVNCALAVVSMVMCGQLCWEVARQKSNLAKRVEIAQTLDSPLSPRMMFVGNLRPSPDNSSSNDLPPRLGPRPIDHFVTVATVTPPTPLSSVSMV